MTWKTPLALLNYLMLAAFLLSVAVQYNDPDPLRWVAIYGMAAFSCILYAIRRLKWPVSGLTGAVALLWALSILPRIRGKVIPLDQVFGTMHMITEAVEETREMGGLLIVFAWMTVLTVSCVPSNRQYESIH